MAMTAGKAFVDTNVLLRSIFKTMPLHHEADRLVKQTREAGSELWISRQVIREYLVQVTHPRFFVRPLTIEEAVQQVVNLELLFKIADETQAVTQQLLSLLKSYPTSGKQVHDANIVATMLVYQIDTLLTQNLDDMKRFSGIMKLLPLVEDVK